MKNKILPILAVLTASAWGPASSVKAQVVIGDFTIPPATAGQLTSFSNLDTNVVGSWRVAPGSTSGIGQIVDQGGGNGYVQMARSFSNSQYQAIGIWIDVASAGLTASTNYSLQFDYLVDRVGSRAYDANASITYAIASANNVYNQVNGAISSSITISDISNGSVIQNYGTQSVSTPGQTAWTTFEGINTFSFAPGTTKLAVLIQGIGFGVGNNNWPDNGEYTYFGIDNVTIAIPEPSTWVLFAAAGTFLVVFRRRRAAKNVG